MNRQPIGAVADASDRVTGNVTIGNILPKKRTIREIVDNPTDMDSLKWIVGALILIKLCK